MGADQPPKPPHRAYLEDEQDPFEPELTPMQAHLAWYAGEVPAVWEPRGGLQRCEGRPEGWPHYGWCPNIAHPDSPDHLCRTCTERADVCPRCFVAPMTYRSWRACSSCYRWMTRNSGNYPSPQAFLEALAEVAARRRARALKGNAPIRRRRP